MWDECPEKHHRRYRELLEPKNAKPNWALLYGSAIHNAIDQWNKHEVVTLQIELPEGIILDGEDEVLLEYWQGVLEVQMERYMIYYAEDFENHEVIMNEEVLRTEFMGITLEGKIDRVWRMGKKIVQVDTKTVSSLDKDKYDGWHFKFQFLFYTWLLAKAKGIVPNEVWVDAIKKPAQRRKKEESTPALIQRIRQEMIQNPQDYFMRIPLLMHKGTLERFEKEILVPKINRIRYLTNDPAPAIVDVLTRNKNTESCHNYGSTCPYLPLCLHGDKAERFRYTEREHKHVELL